MSSSRSGTPHRYRRHLRRSSGMYKVLPQSPKIHYPVDPDNLPLESESIRDKFELLAEQVEEFETHMVDIQLIQHAISSQFNEPFASFMYGMSITMWCNNFPHCPLQDQWEKLQEVEGVDSRIDSLRAKVEAKKQENEALKSRLNRSQTRVEHQKPIVTKTTRRQQPPSEDTYNSTDSFVENPRVSRIPQPSRIDKSKPGKPNLNQAPRYMRGLFDSSNTRATASRVTRARPTIANRPPFR